MISFTLPSAPSVNNLFTNVPGRGRVRSERYRAWIDAACWSMKARHPSGWQMLSGPVAIEITTGNARQDIDNCSKGILDLLAYMRVIDDDKQVVDLRITRGGKPKEAIVTVREI